MHNIQVQEKEDCKVEVQYVADPEKVLEIRATVVDEIFEEASKVAIPGYRKGKAPLSAVKSRFRKTIEERTQRELVTKANNDIIFETKMKTMFYPQVLHSNLNNAYFECNLLFMKKPDFELKEYKGFEIPKPHSPKTPAELAEQMLQELRVKYGDVVPFGETDFVQTNDKVTMDVRCVLGDKEIPELTKQGEFYSVGGGFYKEFDDNILGMTSGEERSFDVLWDTQTQERATFTVKIHMGVKNVPAALDDAFAQKLGLDDLDKLRSEVEGSATKKVQEFERRALVEQIVARLKSGHDFTVPNWLVLLDAQQMASQHNLKWDDVDPASKQMLEGKARERLKNTLIFDAIREAEPELQLSSNEILTVLRNKIIEQGEDPGKFLVEAQQSGRLYGIIAALQQEATLDWLISQSKIIE